MLIRYVIIGATNRIEDIDEAILRRFECKIFVGVPNKETRKKLIIFNLADINYHLSNEDIDQISNVTVGWSCSDIEVTIFSNLT